MTGSNLFLQTNLAWGRPIINLALKKFFEIFLYIAYWYSYKKNYAWDLLSNLLCYRLTRRLPSLQWWILSRQNKWQKRYVSLIWCHILSDYSTGLCFTSCFIYFNIYLISSRPITRFSFWYVGRRPCTIYFYHRASSDRDLRETTRTHCDKENG